MVVNKGQCLDQLPIIFAGISFLCLLCTILGVKYALNMRRRSDIFEDALGAHSYGLVFFDEKDNFYSANQRACEFFPFLNYEEKYEAVDEKISLREFIHYMYDHAVDHEENLNTLVTKSDFQITTHEFREVVSWGDGKLCLVEVHKTKGDRHILLIHDLSVLKQGEDQIMRLSHFSHELTQAIEEATNGILIAKQKGEVFQIVYANETFYAHSGVDEDSVLGRPFSPLMKKVIKEEGQLESLNNALDEREGTNFDLVFEGAGEGGDKWLNLKLSPVKDQEGQTTVFIAVFTDITELRRRDNEMFKTQKLEALGQLAAGIAHDFNNVLSIIDGYSRIASGKTEDPDAIVGYLEKIQTSSQRGADLTSQLLTFSRHKIVKSSVVDVGEAVQEHATLLQPLIDPSIDFQVHIEDLSLAIEAPPDYITQIVMNLAINARDAMSEGGVLKVGVRRCPADEIPPEVKSAGEANDMVCIYVSDDGDGMTEETRSKLFDPFFTTKEQGKGTGLGLFTVYGLVKQMHGYIDVQSKLGEGTTISIFLHLSNKQASKVITGTADDVDTISLEGFTAFIAEDEAELRIIVTEMLEKMGMHVISACNGNEALMKQEDFQGDIDLLLTDVVMPELDGVKLAELFESQRPETSTIFMSGYPADKSSMRVDLPDNAVFMAKPIKYDALAKLIHGTLSNKGQKKPQVSGTPAMPHWELSDVVEKL